MDTSLHQRTFITPIPELKIDRLALWKDLFGVALLFTSAYGKPNVGKQTHLKGAFEACPPVDDMPSVRQIVDQLLAKPDYVTVFKTYAGKRSNRHADIDRLGAINIDLDPSHKSVVLWHLSSGEVIGLHRPSEHAILFNPKVQHTVINDGPVDRFTLSLYYVTRTFQELRTMYRDGGLLAT